VLEAQRLWFQRLKVQHDEPLLNFAFSFTLRRYTEELTEQKKKRLEFSRRRKHYEAGTSTTHIPPRHPHAFTTLVY
jgi:hypothetical protein